MGILWFGTHFLFSRLSIVSNNITGRGLVALAQAVQSNMKLSHIYIWGNKPDRSTCLVSGWGWFVLVCPSIVGKITAISEQDIWFIWGFTCDYNMVVLEWGISTLKGDAMSCLTHTAQSPKPAPRVTFPLFFIPGVLGADRDGPPAAGLHRCGSLRGGWGGFPGRAVPWAGQAPLLGPTLRCRGPRRRQRQPANRRCLGVFVSEAALPVLVPYLVSSKIDFIRLAACCFFGVWV